MTIHKPVLLQESIDVLNLKKGNVVVDATLGGGGHSVAILNRIGESGKLVGIDLDEDALERLKIQISKFKFQIKSKIQNPKIYWESEDNNVILINDNFANLENILEGLKIEKVDAILADLGFSSDQMEEAERGFSFQKDAELDMRFDLRKYESGEITNTSLTAKDIVNNYPEEKLVRILKEYGEEKFARNIARKICEIRKTKEIKTTKQLAEIIESATPKRYHLGKISPATRTFQALRIEVNQELENLKKFIPQAIDALNMGGRLAIISFHSLEDRMVKNIFRENARGCICPPDFPQCVCGHKASIKIFNRKPIIANEEEVKGNPRSRSAKLRVAEKI